ncbi:hypothetical protein Droror1_Dr00001292 [Drosera rotundifolia]
MNPNPPNDPFPFILSSSFFKKFNPSLEVGSRTISIHFHQLFPLFSEFLPFLSSKPSLLRPLWFLSRVTEFITTEALEFVQVFDSWLVFVCSRCRVAVARVEPVCTQVGSCPAARVVRFGRFVTGDVADSRGYSCPKRFGGLSIVLCGFEGEKLKSKWCWYGLLILAMKAYDDAQSVEMIPAMCLK